MFAEFSPNDQNYLSLLENKHKTLTSVLSSPVSLPAGREKKKNKDSEC